MIEGKQQRANERRRTPNQRTSDLISERDSRISDPFPQMGVPAGIILSNLVFLSLSKFLTREQFDSWGMEGAIPVEQRARCDWPIRAIPVGG
jgi:hypothetical protein